MACKRVNFKSLSGTVGTTSAQLIEKNQDRIALIIQNVSENTLSISLDGTTAVAGAAGTLELAAGERIVFSDGIVPINEMQVIASGASSNYTVWEASLTA